jgi:hypothetical protein
MRRLQYLQRRQSLSIENVAASSHSCDLNYSPLSGSALWMIARITTPTLAPNLAALSVTCNLHSKITHENGVCDRLPLRLSKTMIVRLSNPRARRERNESSTEEPHD